MADEQKSKEPIPDIKDNQESSAKEKKLRAAPDEILAKALHDMMLKDHEV